MVARHPAVSTLPWPPLRTLRLKASLAWEVRPGTRMGSMSARPADSRHRPALRVLTALCFFTLLAAYANTLRAPFVYDDTLAILKNPTIQKLWPLSEVLLPQAEGGLTVSGRPILNLSLALSYALGGHEPWAYHVFNISIHAASGLVLFGLTRITLRRRRHGEAAADALALAIAGAWVLHPLQTQAVTYVVQRAEGLMGFFYLLTLYAFARATICHPLDDKGANRHRRNWFGVSVVACALGMGTKEVMATAPLLVLLYDRTFVAGSFAAAWRERRGFYLALGATWLVLAALIASTGGNRGGTVGLGVGVPWWAYGLTQFQAVARYVELSAWPQALVFEYGTFWVRSAGEIAPHAIVVLPLLVATVVALRRWPALGFCGAWFFLILAPTSLTPGTIQMIVEHRMYLPLAAVVAVAAVGLHVILGRRALPVFAATALGMALLTANRNHVYRSHFALWTDTLAKRPDNPRAHSGLAEALDELGQRDAALKHRAEAVRLQPDESTYQFNLALTLADTGRPAAAVPHYQQSLALKPDEPKTHNNLAIVLARLGRPAEALPHSAAAVRLKPDDALYRYNYGIALMRAGRHAEAISHYEAALRVEPNYADAHFNLGAARVRAKQIEEAIADYRSALKLKPSDADYATALGGALLLAGRPAEALGQFQATLAAHPDATEAAFGAANALAALRRFDEAIAHYQRLLQQAPGHANAHFKLGNTLLDVDRVSEAAMHYESAVRLSPADAEAQHNLGIAYAKLERWPDARRQFETALRLKPDYADARRSLEQLSRLPGR